MDRQQIINALIDGETLIHVDPDGIEWRAYLTDDDWYIVGNNENFDSSEETIVDSMEAIGPLDQWYDLEEDLARISHEIWSHWMKYLFSKCIKNIQYGVEDGSVTIPKEQVERWMRQMNTPYKELSDKEKQSDLDQAKKIIEVISNYIEEY